MTESSVGRQASNASGGTESLVPALSLPKGGGAIRGLGEKFGANAWSGTAGVTVPLPLSSSRQGSAPALALAYDSGGAAGPFGLGWRLSSPDVVRKTSRGVPTYADGDIFLLGDGDDLVAVLDGLGRPLVDVASVPGYQITRFQPRVEGEFTRIEKWLRMGDGDTHWRALSGDNVLSVFGRTVGDRIHDPADPLRVYRWLLSETRDPLGNAVVYEYVSEDNVGVDMAAAHESGPRDRTTQRYLKRVHYGNQTPLLDENGRRPIDLTDEQRASAGWLFEVVLDYGDHDPVAPAPQADRPWTIRSDPFSGYKSGFEIRTYRLCQRALIFHHFPLEHGIGDDCLVAALELGYTTDRLALLTTLTHRGYTRRSGGGYDSAVLPPLRLDYRASAIDPTVHEIGLGQLEGIPTGFTGRPYQWVDLHGEGMPGFLTEHRNTWFFKPNLGGGRFGPLAPMTDSPSIAALSAGRQAFVDVTGDGRADLMQLVPPLPGYAANTDGRGWRDFLPFEALPELDLARDDMQLVDLTGDGRPDLLVTADDALVWYQSLGEQGFAAALRIALPEDEDLGPRLVRADAQQAVFLADMSGDGLFDLVRLRHSEVCYWPGLGRGRFGRRVIMSNSPDLDTVDAFDARRVRLADVDGSGTADLLYVGRGMVSLLFNQSGNSWSEASVLPPFPHLDDLSIVEVADLLGSGTACLVWSTPDAVDTPLRYVDLMPGGPPRLLVGTSNSMGAETRVDYTPSTSYMVADREAGRPWLTRLPFPVQVVSKVEVRDHVIGTRLTSHYAYRHGYFDAVEREFRGFATVEQADTEAFADYATGVKASASTQDMTPELFQPPVVTRSWFHTGAFPDQTDLAVSLRTEFFQQRQDLPATDFPTGLSTLEYRACVRALKGALLRTETYSPDGTPEAAKPYSVTEHRFSVRRIQAAVVQPVEIESLTTHYERNASDPRVIHAMVLDTDKFGRPTASASIAYGRRTADASLPDDVAADQARTWVTAQRTAEAPEIDRSAPVPAYRLPAAWETRSWELTGVTPAGPRYTREEIGAALGSATEVEYSADPAPGVASRRLIGWGRAQFLDDTAAPLPFGQQGSLGLFHRAYRLAFPQPVVDTYYGTTITDADWADAGYVTPTGLSGRWVPTGTSDYPAQPAAHFYLPSGATDPFGVSTTITRDRYDLLVQSVRTTGAAWLSSSVVNDYRVLGPVQLTDVNGNRSAVRHDPLGFVVRSALMGKAGSAEGDTLDDPTTILEYDLTRWATARTPNVTHVRAREEFGAANTAWRETYLYATGTGGAAVVKTQAPDGWLATGRTIVNNKGNPVKQYEPYYSPIPDYDTLEALATVGVTPVLRYDPLGRLVRTDLPNGTFSAVVFTPWKSADSDPNDTVLDSRWYAERGSPDPTGPEPADPEVRAAWLAAKHARTPSVAHLDSLGRTVLAVGDVGGGTTAALRSMADLTGRRTSLVDPLGREVGAGFRSMAGTPVFARTAERGSRWMFPDITGVPVRSWDGIGRVFRNRFDGLRRPLSVSVQDGAGPQMLLSYVVYGDRKPDATARNLNGVAHQTYDGAGMVAIDSRDFTGIPGSVTRTLAQDPTVPPDWAPLAAAADYAALQTAAAALLSTADAYTASSTHDALGRTLTLTLPDGTAVTPGYDRASRLCGLTVRIAGAAVATPFLASQTYDAKGQRLSSQHGNGVAVTFGYDPETFRLADLTAAATGSDPVTQALQKLHYTYDPVGNIVRLADDAQQTLFFANAVVSPEATYEYDPLYRLITATGRELAAGNDAARVWDDLPVSTPVPHVNDVAAVRRYTERYEYDLCGNIMALRHFAPVATGSWTRHYRYRYQDDPTDTTNRLAATSRPGDPDGGPYTQTYDYDAYGNFARLRTPTPGELSWNMLDQLQKVDLGGGGAAYYSYGADGTRLRKVIDRPGGLRQERIYLGALEIYREYRQSAAPSLVRNTVHISDDAGRIAQVDTKTVDSAGTDPANEIGVPLVRYQYANSLSSAVIETDDAANVISYEEYHPYGTTAYRSAKSSAGVSLKRYRFAGKELDDETGLYCIGARYFAPWLGRWTSPDPAGFADGLNQWRYCRNNPVMLRDSSGLGPDDERPVGIPGQATGNESIDDLQGWAANAGWSIDTSNLDQKRLKEQHFRSINGVGQWFGFHFRPLGAPAAQGNVGFTAPTPTPTPPPQAPAPPAQALPGTDFAGAAKAGRQAYRGTNSMPPGTEVQHWTKERSSAAANIAPSVMNQNLSPLQSRVGGTPTTLLVPPRAGSTVTYTVEGTPALRTEHKFADNRLIPMEEQNLTQANPSIDPGVRSIEAGRMARWRMTGDPGPAPGPGYGRAVPLGQVLENLPPEGSPPSSPSRGLFGPGFASNVGGSLARTFIPGFAEAEVVGLFAHPFVVGTLGVTSGAAPEIAAAISAAPTTFAASVMLPLYGGAIAGNLVERAVSSAGGSAGLSIGTAVASAAATGAIIGTFIPVPGLGTAAGAAVGAAIGVIGYGLSKLFF